eukprot:Rhum_TRINITY_DN3322_c0_g1::Rhum_TRINITY_DN3322_c0_g1_i1::g.10358::m.10358
MSHLTALAALAVVGSVSGTWVDLFKPPFTGAPVGIMLGVSCAKSASPTATDCLLSGGNTNTGFGVYKIADKLFQNATKMPIGSLEPVMMLMSVAMNDEKHAVVGGVELGIGGTYFSVNGEYFNASLEVGIVSTQAVYALGGARYAMVGQDDANQGPATSADYGLTFTAHGWPKGFSPQAPPRYGAFPGEKTWYVTGGAWPNTTSTQAGLRHLTSKVAVDTKNGRYVRTGAKVGAPESGATGQYGALIAKTIDGGKTWTKQYESTGKYYFNGISCWDENTCMAVAEGFAKDGSTDPGAHIFSTTDGKTWTDVHVVGAKTGGSGLAIEMLSATEAWVGTTAADAAAFVHTTDGGKTWTQASALAEIGDVMSMSFVNSKLAYAVAITVWQDSTVLAMGVDAPTAAASTFTQKICPTASCTTGCQSHSLPIGQCLSVTGGGSAMVESCAAAGLVIKMYTAIGCTGASTSQTQPVNKCVQ